LIGAAFRGLLIGVIGRSYQGAGLDVLEPQPPADLSPVLEFGWMHPAVHRQMPRRRAQVLAQR